MNAGTLAKRVALLAASATALSAQQVVRGRVIDSLKAPIVGVEINCGPLQTTSASDGSFELAGFPVGSSRLAFRRIGYASISITVNFHTPDTLERTFTMYRLRSLDTVIVKADSSVRIGLSTYEHRRRDGTRTGRGKFLDEAMLAKAGSVKLGDIIGTETGFYAVRLCSRLLIATSRGSSTGPVAPARLSRIGCQLPVTRDGRSLYCYAQVFVDGVRVYVMGGSQDPPNFDDYALSSLYAVELYSGSSDTPAELNATGSACGTVAIWTKR